MSPKPPAPRAALVYLHGFASGPSSSKAQVLKQRFAALGVPMALPDLNEGEGGFERLTVTRMIAATRAAMARARAESGLPADGPVALLGSSLGGYTSALVAAREPSVVAAVLLAPAFCFPERLEKRIRDEDPGVLDRGFFETFHYARNQNCRIATDIVTDGRQYEAWPEVRCPALIIHGKRDDVVPVDLSREFSKSRQNVKLLELDDDHQLTSSVERIWTEARAFLSPWLA